MSEAFVINREFLFKTSIYEITSISIEHNYDIVGSYVQGEFIISGDYRLHEISINKEDFSFKVPFKHEIRSNINLDSVEVEITDFSYEFRNEDELSVHIEYTVSGEEGLIEFEDEKSLDEFLKDKDAEVVDLSEDDVKEDREKIEETREDDALEEIIDNEIDMPKALDNNPNNMILNSVNSEDNYVKYHVHTVTMEDTIESICSKYAVNLNTLKKYNTFDNLELNMKLLIPENEES